MKRKDMPRLERAFTEMPPELPDKIEMAFKRGEIEMKRRHKLMLTLTAVAAALILLTGLALAAGRLTKPRPDVVVAARGGATAEPTDLEEDLLPEVTATPEVTPEPTPTPEVTPEPTPLQMATDALKIVYTQPQSNYYHSVPDCSGMVGAIEWTEASAISVGKQPCPVCITGKVEITVPNTPMPELEAPFEAPVYYTAGGVYYHGDEQCSGMKNAAPHTLAEAEADGKLRCPECQPVEPDHYDLFLEAFGQGLEALMPGYAYCYCGGGFLEEPAWHMTDGEAYIAVCQVSSFLEADEQRPSDVNSVLGSKLDDVLCVSFNSLALDNLWPFLASTKAGETAFREKDEAVEAALEEAGFDAPLSLEEQNAWVAIGSDGAIRELEVYYVDDDSDVTVTLAWRLTDGEYVFMGTVE